MQCKAIYINLGNIFYDVTVYLTKELRKMRKSRHKMATDARLLGLERRCPECNTSIKSNGHMYYNKRLSSWAIGFWCSLEKEVFSIWKPEYQPLIDEIAKGLNIDDLPDKPPHASP